MWCITIHEEGDWRPRYDTETMAYLCYQVEICPSTGRRHIQAYVRLRHPKTMAATKVLFSADAHLEVALGSEEQNRVYCSKEASRAPNTTFVEFGVYDGTKGKKGKRSDIEAVTAAIKEGQSVTEIALNFPEQFLKFHAGIQALSCHIQTKNQVLEREIHTTILWGPTATGKSHRIRHAIPMEDLYVLSPGRDPWGMYSGQKNLLFEEFNPASWDLMVMNATLDKWPLQLDARYSNKVARWTVVYICSNSDPAYWYSMDARLMEKTAFIRRISEPMGKVYNIIHQEQVVDLKWWEKPPQATPPPATPLLNPFSPAPTQSAVDFQALGGAGTSTVQWPPPPLTRAPSMTLSASMLGGGTSPPIFIDD